LNAEISPFTQRQSMLSTNFEIFHYRDPYFKAPDFHSHDFFEFYFFIDGSVTYHIEENSYELVPGDVLVIPPGELHRPVIVNNKTAYERIVLWINEKAIYEILKEKELTKEIIDLFKDKNHLVNFKKEEFKLNLDLLKSVIELQKSGKREDAVLVTSYVSIVLINLYKMLSQYPVKENRAESTISKLILFINENVEKDLTLDYLSEKFFISKYHMIRMFKNYTNTTIGQYITSKRITKAKLYIKQGDNILEASRKSGFTNYSNFYKAFVKETGMSPSKYQAQLK